MVASTVWLSPEARCAPRQRGERRDCHEVRVSRDTSICIVERLEASACRENPGTFANESGTAWRRIAGSDLIAWKVKVIGDELGNLAIAETEERRG